MYESIPIPLAHVALDITDRCPEVYTALQKFGNALEKWGFGQYWHESFLICDNFALIRDNTNYEKIFYYST